MSLQFYRGTADEDLLIAQWYLRMVNDGDLPHVFSRDSWTLSALFRIVGPPKVLTYETDAEGIWFAFWAESFMNAVMTGLWIRQGKRSRLGLYNFLDVAAFHLARVPTIFGITKQEKLLELHENLGYTVVDEVAGLFDGETAWLVKLTRPALAKTLERWRRPSVELAQAMDLAAAHTNGGG